MPASIAGGVGCGGAVGEGGALLGSGCRCGEKVCRKLLWWAERGYAWSLLAMGGGVAVRHHRWAIAPQHVEHLRMVLSVFKGVCCERTARFPSYGLWYCLILFDSVRWGRQRCAMPAWNACLVSRVVAPCAACAATAEPCRSQSVLICVVSNLATGAALLGRGPPL